MELLGPIWQGRATPQVVAPPTMWGGGSGSILDEEEKTHFGVIMAIASSLVVMKGPEIKLTRVEGPTTLDLTAQLRTNLNGHLIKKFN